MKLTRTVPWLVASFISGGLAWLVSTAPVGDPISAGFVGLGTWGIGIIAALCLAVFIYEAVR